MGPRFRMGRRRGLVVGAAVGAGMANRANKNNQQASDENQAQVSEPAGNDSQIEELTKLAQLKDQGILTEEEFTAKKKQILGI